MTFELDNLSHISPPFGTPENSIECQILCVTSLLPFYHIYNIQYAHMYKLYINLLPISTVFFSICAFPHYCIILNWQHGLLVDLITCVFLFFWMWQHCGDTTILPHKHAPTCKDFIASIICVARKPKIRLWSCDVQTSTIKAHQLWNKIAIWGKYRGIHTSLRASDCFLRGHFNLCPLVTVSDVWSCPQGIRPCFWVLEWWEGYFISTLEGICLVLSILFGNVCVCVCVNVYGKVWACVLNLTHIWVKYGLNIPFWNFTAVWQTTASP